MGGGRLDFAITRLSGMPAMCMFLKMTFGMVEWVEEKRGVQEDV